jgi:hypothetical protein
MVFGIGEVYILVLSIKNYIYKSDEMIQFKQLREKTVKDQDTKQKQNEI